MFEFIKRPIRQMKQHPQYVKVSEIVGVLFAVYVVIANGLKVVRIWKTMGSGQHEILIILTVIAALIVGFIIWKDKSIKSSEP